MPSAPKAEEMATLLPKFRMPRKEFVVESNSPLGAEYLRPDLALVLKVVHASGSSFTRNAVEEESSNRTAGTVLLPAEIAGSPNSSESVDGSAKRTTSPTTNNVGAASFGERCKSAIVERCVRWCAVVAREMTAHGVSPERPAALSLVATSE